MTSPAIKSMVKAMRAAGCPAEQIVEAVCAYEAEADVDPAMQVKAARQARNARYYERQKERLKASESVLIKTAKTISDEIKTNDAEISRVRVLYAKKYLYNNPLPLPLTSSTPREPLSAKGEGFGQFWQAMPSPDPAAKAAALTAFARLSPADQAQAIAAAGRYASAFSAKPTTHPISPARFIRERCFEGYGPPAASAGIAPVFVRLDTPQWRAWAQHRGKPIPLNREGTGWHFPSEWPLEARQGAA